MTLDTLPCRGTTFAANMCMTPTNRAVYMLSVAGAAAIAAYVMRRTRIRAQELHLEETLDASLADTFPASDALPFSGLAEPAGRDR